MERPRDLNLLRTFIAVAELRRVTRAAKALGLPKSTVSRQIAKLEETYAQILFLRSGDGLDLTPFGRRLFERTRQPIQALSQNLLETGNEDAPGSVSLYAPAIYGRGLLKPILQSYLKQHPNISMELVLGDRFSTPDPNAIDLTISVGQSPGKLFEIWSLRPVEAKLYGAPILFEEQEPPHGTPDLPNWPFLTNNCSPGTNAKVSLLCKGSDVMAATGPIRMVSNDPDALAEAAVQGLGIARLPTFVAAPFVEDGRLIPVLTDCVLDRHTVTLCKAHRNTNQAARSLIDFIVSELGR